MLSTIRHDAIFPVLYRHDPITIIGAGATGSRVFAALAELGLKNIEIYDDDTVSAHNLANQIYDSNDIGRYKTEALQKWAANKLEIIPPGIQFHTERVTENTHLRGSVFLLVDSMEQRKAIYEGCLKDNFHVFRVIDTRMAATHGNIYTFEPQTQGTQWVSTLIEDDQAEVSACGTSLTVGATASIIANLAVWQFIHAIQDPGALDGIIDIFLKPLCLSTEKWD